MAHGYILFRLLGSMLVSYSCHNKLTQTWRFKTKRIYSLLILEAISLKSGVSRPMFLPKAQEENPSSLSLASRGSQQFLPVLDLCSSAPISVSVFTWPSSLCEGSNLSLLTMIPGIGFRGHPKSARPNVNLIISTKTQCPNKIVFTGTKDEDVNTSFKGYKANHDRQFTAVM